MWKGQRPGPRKLIQGMCWLCRTEGGAEEDDETITVANGKVYGFHGNPRLVVP